MGIKRVWVTATVCVLAALSACTPLPPPASTKDCTVRAPRANLKGCDLREEVFGGVPDPDGGLADYLEMDLTEANLAKTNLTGASFRSGATMDLASFRDANLSGADFREDAGVFNRLSMKDNDFVRANLSNATLDTAYLTGGDFTDATMTAMDLYSAGLSGTFVHADLSGSSFQSWSYLDGDLREASLVGASFGSISALSGDLRGADLSSASFSWSSLTGDLRGASLRQATFNSADITSADLTGADLTSASFTAVTFQDVDLTNADLTGATFSTDSGSGPNTFTNVTWQDTTCPNGVVQSTPCF